MRIRPFALRPLLLLALVGALTVPVRSQSALPPSIGNPDAQYDEARTLFDARLFASAAEAFEAFRERYPDSPRTAEALFFEAESALNVGDESRAAALFETFQTRYPAHALASRARLALATRYYGAGRYDDAETALLAALDAPQPPADAARTRYLLGQTALRQGRTSVALSYFDDAASDYPDTPTAPRALYASATTQAQDGQWSGAATAFARLVQRYPDSPENANAGLGLAEAYARLGRFDDAAEEASRRLPTLTGDDRARGQLLQGDALLRLGQRDAARTAFLAVPADGPYGRRARFGLARFAFDEGNLSTAAEDFATVRNGASESDDPGGRDDALAHEATYYEGLALKGLGMLGEAERRLAAATLRRPSGAYADAALLELGLLRYERRDYEAAANAFDALLRDYSRSPVAGEAARMLGEAYAALGDTRRAREANRRAEELGAASPGLGIEVEFQDAYSLYRDGQYAAAVPRLVAVYRQDARGPRAGEALFWAAESAFQAGDYARAESILGQFLQEFPDHRQADAARYVRAWTHFKRRDYAAAANNFERFLSAYQRSAESVPYYADALLRLGDSYYALRRFDEAIRVYARVGSATQDRRGQDYALFQTGQAHAAAGRTTEALATYNRVLSDFPNSALKPEARYARGALFFQQENYPAAIAEYRQVLETSPNSAIAPKALYGIGDAHYNAGDLEQAEAAYRRVLERYPDSPFVANALDGLDFALQGLGRGDELPAIIAAYEARNPDPSGRERLRLRQTQLAFENGRFDEAIDGARSFVQASRDRDLVSQALMILGSAHAALGQWTDAANAFARLAQQYPESPLRAAAVLRLGEAYLKADDPGRAQAALEDFAERFPGDAEQIGAALFAEALALQELGRERDAEARLAQLLSEYPDTSAAAEARRRAGGE